jgi:predicted nucleic acid-binding protein
MESDSSSWSLDSMKSFVVLDTSPASIYCKNPSLPDVLSVRAWVDGLQKSGTIVVLPEIVDFEVRRKLLHLNLDASLERLDQMATDLEYVKLTTATMRMAAQLWADARARGRPTSGSRALDADSILAAQALLLAGPGDSVTIATENVGHLGQFVDARPWASIA